MTTPPPSPDIREVLRTHWVRLIEDLIVDDLVHHLFAAKIFNQSTLEQICAKKITRDRNYFCLQRLQQKGPDALPAFLEALFATDQEHLCDLIQPGFVEQRKGKDNKTDINLNPVAHLLQPLILTPTMKTSNFGNVVAQTESSPLPSPKTKRSSRPNSLYGSIFGPASPSTAFFSGLDSPETGSGTASLSCSYGDIAGSPDSPIRTFPTCIDIDVKLIPSPIPQHIAERIVSPGVYRNLTKPKGLCLIVNNRDFSKSGIGLQYREGSDRDASYLSWLFERIGYKVIVEKDLDAEALENALQSFANHPDHEFAHSAIVVVLSHGQESGVYGTDGLVVKCQTILDMMDGELCPLLIKKPKLFFIQACRGRLRNPGCEVPRISESESGRSRHASHTSERRRSLTPGRAFEETNFSRTASGGVGPRRFNFSGLAPDRSDALSSLERDDAIRDVDQPDPPTTSWSFVSEGSFDEPMDDDVPRVRRTIPKNSDMLVSYSTIPGHVSFRHEAVGSWYVQAMVDVFSQHAHEKDIHALLTMVNRKVATCSTSDLERPFKQMPAPVNHLMKDFYFFPGLHIEPGEEEALVFQRVVDEPDLQGRSLSNDQKMKATPSRYSTL